jgi:hypothetical protein
MFRTPRHPHPRSRCRRPFRQNRGGLRSAAAAALCCIFTARLQAAPPRIVPAVVGRWDLTVRSPEGAYPSWLEVKLSGRKTLVAYFVSRGGSMRPISQVFFTGNRLRFSVPVQWEQGTRGLSFEGRLVDGRLTGQTVTEDGRRLPWTGARAPTLRRLREPEWGSPVDLFNGSSLTGWKPRDARKPNGWTARYGLLRNSRPGNDLVTERKWTDFKLHAEFRYPKGSNSGIYLRGRYEAQIEDNYGLEPESHQIGGIYGFLTPRVNAARRPGAWQTYDITLVGRRVTVVLNGETVIDRQEIPGITGGALDSREGEPGPIFLQGDHGPIDFRRITLTPAR